VSADRSQVPRSTPLPRLSFPGYERRRLSSGLEWILVPRTGVPLVEALLLLPAGGDRDPRARPGLASLTAALVDEGTRRRSGPELALDVERLGARLSTAAGWDAAQIEIELLAPDLERGLRTVAEVAREPIFPEAELERLRHQVLTEIGRRRDQPPLLAEEALATTLYEGDAYDHLLQGTAESLAALSREEVARFHTEGFLPRGAHLLLGGDIAVSSTPGEGSRFAVTLRGLTPDALCEDGASARAGPAQPAPVRARVTQEQHAPTPAAPGREEVALGAPTPAD